MNEKENSLENEVNNDDLINSLDLPETKEELVKEENKIYDINVNNIDDVLRLLLGKGYDFVTFEPNDSEVKLEFRKEGVVTETKFVKYPIYSGILMKAKAATKLKLDTTTEEQEGNGEVAFEGKTLKLASKVVPSNFGEKLFLKATEISKKLEKKETKPVSFSQIFSFLLVTALVGLIVGGSFLTFIVLNAQTVEDVRFFTSLGISLNDINAFIAQVVLIVFSALVLVETIALIIFLFKAFLTPKEQKKKKVAFWILSIIAMIITFSTLAAWMVIDRKVNSLDNWEELSHGNILLFDNDKLIDTANFSRMNALLNDTSYIIGPINIRFDLSAFADSQSRRGIIVEKYVWNFNGEIIETTTPDELIKTFDRVVTIDSNSTVTLVGRDLAGKEISIEERIPRINIAYVVGVTERTLDSGGKQVTFDASSLEQLGRIEWYNLENLNTPIWERSTFITPVFFRDTIFVMKVRGASGDIIRLFLIRGEDEVAIDGRIDYERGATNDLDITFRVVDVENRYGLGFIERYIWRIGNQTYTRTGNPDNPTVSSEVRHTFTTYGRQEISVELINSAGESRTISTIIDLSRVLKISEGISFFADGRKLTSNVFYNPGINEYLINGLEIPTELTFDGRNVVLDSPLYSLQDIEWDFNSNGDVDTKGKTATYAFNTEGDHSVTANIIFANRRNAEELIKMEQKILIQSIRREAIVDFVINRENNSYYVPLTVDFDASKSSVRDANIVKFTWDFGDGTMSEGDAVVKGHFYTEAGEYSIKLTITTDDGRSFSTTRALVLIPKPQSVNISPSLKSAPVNQGIDFSSAGSEGQIVNYRWDFGDGFISTEANPTHSFSAPGKYKVTLRLEFINRTILENSVEIEIY